jgi:hypothetical protein
VRAEPSVPWLGRPAAAQVHRRNPKKPRARSVRRAGPGRFRPGPVPGPARYRSAHRESRPGTSPARPEPGPAGRPGKPRAGFRGSAAEAAAEGLKKEDHESPAPREQSQQHSSTQTATSVQRKRKGAAGKNQIWRRARKPDLKGHETAARRSAACEMSHEAEAQNTNMHRAHELPQDRAYEDTACCHSRPVVADSEARPRH